MSGRGGLPLAARLTPRSAGRFSIWVAAALVSCEYALFSSAFDSAQLRARADAWAGAGYLGSLGALVATVGVGTLLLPLLDAPHTLAPLSRGRQVDRVVLVRLCAHAGLLALLWWVTQRMLAPGGPPAGPAALWLIAWLLLVLAVPLLAVAAAVPTDLLAPLDRRLPIQLLVGATIGAGAWVAGLGSSRLWWPLGPWMLSAIHEVLRVIVGSPYYDPANFIVGTSRFLVIVSPVCSGFEGLGLTTVFVTAYLYLVRERLRFPQAMLLLPLALAASLLANVARIVLLVLVGSWISANIAAAGFHARAGWLFFCVLALTIVSLARYLAFFTRDQLETSLDTPTAAYLLPFLALLAAAFVTGLVTVGVDYWYGLRIVSALVALRAFRHHYADARPRVTAAAVLAGVAAGISFIALSPLVPSDTLAAWQRDWHSLSPMARTAWVAIRVLGSIAVVPLAEELAFRGYVMRRVVDVDFESVAPAQRSWLALAIAAGAFGFVHSGWLGGTVAGVLFGLAQWRGGRIGDAVTAHVVSNALVAAWAVGFGRWEIWM